MVETRAIHIATKPDSPERTRAIAREDCTQHSVMLERLDEISSLNTQQLHFAIKEMYLYMNSSNLSHRRVRVSLCQLSSLHPTPQCHNDQPPLQSIVHLEMLQARKSPSYTRRVYHRIHCQHQSHLYRNDLTCSWTHNLFHS